MISIEEINIICNCNCNVDKIIAFVSLFIAIISVGVAFYIGRKQIEQNEEMEKLQRKIDERDEKRHMDDINSKSNAFLTKYIDNIKLLPLCAIASMYKTSSNFIKYSNEMYNEFSVLPIEIQNNILKLGKIDIEIREEKNFYVNSMNKLLNIVKEVGNKEDLKFFKERNEKIILRNIEELKSIKIEDYITKKENEELVLLLLCDIDNIINKKNRVFNDFEEVLNKELEIKLRDRILKRQIDEKFWSSYVTCLFLQLYLIEYINIKFNKEYDYFKDFFVNTIEDGFLNFLYLIDLISNVCDVI